jgi:ethanolamine utilization protein EutN
MIKATVIGPVWATKRIDGFPAGALLEVEQEGTGHRLVALDHLGAGPGDNVLVTVGSAVTRHLPGEPPLDALIVGVLDDLTPRASEQAGAPLP